MTCDIHLLNSPKRVVSIYHIRIAKEEEGEEQEEEEGEKEEGESPL